MANDVIVGGKAYRCQAEVVNWRVSGLHFAGLAMRERTDFIVAHWTGGEGDAKAAFTTMKTRADKKTGKSLNLSAHFYISAKGVVWQYCDASMRCSHAGPRGNKRSVGIEAANRATAVREEHGLVREVVRECVNGEVSDRTTFTAPQMRAYLALLETLCGAYNLPFAVPMNGADVNPNVVPDEFLATFRGVVGHFHLEKHKPDCGLALLRAIAAKPKRGQSGAAE